MPELQPMDVRLSLKNAPTAPKNWQPSEPVARDLAPILGSMVEGVGHQAQTVVPRLVTIFATIDKKEPWEGNPYGMVKDRPIPTVFSLL